MKIKSLILTGVMVGSVIFSFPVNSEAAQVKKVYRGLINFDTTDIVQSADIGGSVDRSKSIILITSNAATNTQDQAQFFTAQFEDNSTITINRSGGAYYAAVAWQVVEFSYGVTVHRGISSMQAKVLTKQIDLPASVDTAKSLPIVYTQNTETASTITDQMFLIPTFASSSVLQLDRKRSTGTKAINITWQVAEFTADADVYTGLTNMPVPGADTYDQYVTTTQTLKNSGSNTLLFTYVNPNTGHAGRDSHIQVRSWITAGSPATITFLRQAGYAAATYPTTDVDIRWYALDLNDGTNGLGLVQTDHSNIIPMGTTARNISSSTNANPITVTTSANHGYQIGQVVNINGHTTNTAANGTWIISAVPANNTFRMQGSVGNGVGGATGTVTPAGYVSQVTRIVSSTNANPTVITTYTSHGFTVGQSITVSDHTTNTNANGTWTVGSVPTPKSFSLSGRAGNGVGGASGYVRPAGSLFFSIASSTNASPIEITTSTAHSFVVGDSVIISNHTVNTAAVGTWVVGSVPTSTTLTLTGSTGNGVGGATGQVTAMALRNITISSSTDAIPGPISITTSQNHGYVTGQVVNIAAHTTNTNANGIWEITRTGLTTFTLNGSEGTGAGAGGATGTVVPSVTGVLGTLTQLNRTINNVSCTGSYVGMTNSQSYYDDLNLISHLSNNASTGNNEISFMRDVSNTALTARCNYAAYEFPPLTITSPNGGDTLYVGIPVNITWAHSADLETGGTYSGGPKHKCKLEVSVDGGSSYLAEVISDTVDCTADTYSWNPPASMSSTDLDQTDIRIKITDTDLATRNTDTSNTDFTIKGTFTVTAPNGGQSWVVNEEEAITWTNTGNLDDNGTVAIKLYSSGGSVLDSTILAAGTVAPSVGTYAWTLGDKIGSDWRVGVEASWDAAGVNDKSNSDFSIKGSLTLTAPNGGEDWPAQTSQNITWTKQGTFSTVKLEYSTNSGGSYPNPIATGVTASDLTYAWTVPVDAESEFVRVKVSNEADTSVNDTSNADFTVVASIEITSPTTGAEVWRVGTNQNITWTINGTIPTVKLEYSVNGGSSYVNTIDTGYAGSLGTFSWSIPDAIGDNVRIKISDEAAPLTRYDESDNDFKIRGNITVLEPDGGEAWPVGSSQIISWTKDGSIGNVDLFYSTNGGSSYPNALTTNNSSVNWIWDPVPDVISSSLRIRVQASNPAYASDTYGNSSANFAIKGSLTITSPNGSEQWGANTSHNITWNKTGTIGSIKLEYSTDGGVDNYPNLIVGATAPDNASATSGYYTWGLPSTVGTQFRVRASLLSDLTVNDASNANFSIRGSVTIVTPNGGQTWIVGDEQYIDWSIGGTITNLKLEYSTNSGSTYIPAGLITSSTPAAALSYTWTIPDAIGAALRIRASDAADSSVNDESDADFTIKGSLTLTAPNGGDIWVVGTSEDIEWTKTGTIASVALDYSTDGGSTYPNVITASTPGALLAYSWTIPDAIGTNLKVRVSNFADALVNDESDFAFGIKGSITVATPNGGEAWSVGDSEDITWTKTGTLTGNLKLEYSTDAGGSWPVGNLITNTQAASGSSYAWTVPDAPTVQGRVRITQLDNTSVLDASDGSFSIKGQFILDDPNGGETWIVGESRDINWQRIGSIANARLDYSVNGGSTYPNQITASTPASNESYTWTIPDAIGAQLRVKVTDANDSSVSDASDANFTVKGSVTLTAPNGGQTWVVGASENITWTKTGTIANVKLEYSTNAFATEAETTEITASTPGADLSYAWTIPDAIDNSIKVRITNLADATVTDVSDANFSVKGSLTMGSPNGTETWVVGESRNIIWTMTGSIANVKLEYSTNAFLNETETTVITASTAAETNPPNGAGSGQYAWTVADAIGTNLKMRVTDVTNATVTDVSNAAFEIMGSVTLTSPNGTEVWAVASDHAITWTRTGSFNNVKLTYSTDSGSNYSNLISASTPADPAPVDNAGTFTWTIPDDITTQARVRVANAADENDVRDESDANFKIRGGLAISTPNGGEKWTVGQVQNVSWSKFGTISSTVKLDYSTDGGSTYPNSIATGLHVVNASPYAWTIPSDTSLTVKVRVMSEADVDTYDVSDANFKIMPKFTISSPNGGEVWSVASSQSLGWTTDGSSPNVKLTYSTDGGVGYGNIISASTSNTGSYSWTVPDAIGTAVRLKVEQSTDSDAFDTSNANFKIRGVILVVAPNGGNQWNIASSQNIQWTRTGSISNVKIEYSSNAFADELETTVIIASTAADTAPPDDAGVYAWTIPDTPGITNKVRVSDASDATAYDTSNANFSIKGSLTLDVPNGGQTWIVATTQNIQWTRSGSIPNVKLEYSTDSGGTWPVGNVIIASTPADPAPSDDIGTYSWTIPDEIGDNLRVRVSDAADASVEDTSSADFEVKGSVDVTSPNGGETWYVGDTENVTWSSEGSFLNVKLEYSTDAFATEDYVTVISGSTPNDGTYSWPIPDSIGTSLKIRVTDASDAAVTDVSDAAFTIKGTLTVTSPNGTELWKVGEARSVTWNRTGTFADVKIEYSTNGGSSYPNTITASTDATTGTYAWTVPDAIGAQVRVKVTNLADNSVNDASNANFEIKGTIILTAPNGGQAWAVSSLQNVTWTKTGTYATVKLEYSTNAFASELETTVIATGVDSVTGTPYSWTIPDAIDSTVKVRVTNESDAAVTDVSDTNFKIVGSLTLDAPNGGESWAVGSTQTVSWTPVGSIADVKLEYSTNSGSTYPNVITASTAAGAGAYNWTIPDSIGSTRRVKITDASDATVNDTSAADFTIKGGFEITDPNGGEVWTVGSAQAIEWTTTGSVANVKLEYSTNAFSNESQTTVVAASTANTGTYSWTVPDAISNLVRTRVSDVNNSDANDISNASFKIRGALAVTAPNGGNQWLIGNSENIAWTRTGSIANVKVEYSSNAFADELQTEVIVASTPADPAPSDNAGTYSWAIPDNPGTSNKVRVTDASDATVLDTSNANFSIKGQLILSSPNGAEVWVVATNQNIQWTKYGSITNVKLEYSEDSGDTWPGGNLIVASTAADPPPTDDIGTYSWTIDDAIGTNVRVRVSDASDPSTLDVSNADFKIRGSIAMTSPNGGEAWVVGSSNNITWNSAGSYSNVKLEYSTNGFSDESETVTITSSTPNDGSFSWTVPDAIDTSVKVRGSDASDSTVNDMSNADFTIKGSLDLTSPDGGETWKVGESRAITWNRTGSIANVKLQYSVNGGSAYANTITNSTDASTGTYAWTVPDAIGTQLRVRISDVSDGTVEDTSSANFAIKGTVVLVAPNGGETWVVDDLNNITWTKTGTYATVKLEYSTNAFADELQTTTIATGVDSVTGTPYSWSVPDTIGSALRVRISNETDPTVVDTSNLSFSIVGSLTLTAPNGGESWGVGTTQTITWERVGSIANAKLELSSNGGSSYGTVISASTGAAAEAYLWTIPDSIGTNRKVKISDATNANVNDVSAANFTIMGAFDVTDPDGGEVWTVASAQSVEWTTTGTVSNVKLEYSKNAFSDESQTTVIIASTANTGTYSWTVADAISNLMKVRVSDVNNADANAVSSAIFKIRGAILVTDPNGGEPWEIGTDQNITWNRTGSISAVKIEYSTNGFSDELQTDVIVASTDASTGTYEWTIPDTPGTTNKIRVTDASDATVLDTSNANFTIKGRLVLSIPSDSGIVWTVAGVNNITWTKFGAITNVALYYSNDSGGTWPGGNIIVASTAADPAPADDIGVYSWTIPDSIATTMRVRVQDAADSSTYDDSNNDFKIRGAITMTSPNGGEVWIVGASQDITWTSEGSYSNVKLEYSTNAFANEDNTFSITAATPNDGTFSWTIPDAIGSTVRVRGSDASDSTVNDMSNANFTVKGSLTLTSPNGTEVWKVGEARNVTWNRTGSIANVKLERSVNGGSSYGSTITNSTDASTGTYAWTVPDAIGTQLRVKVSDVTDATVEDASNANFEIKGTVVLVAPNGGEVWTVADLEDITWTKTGTYSTVKLEYSTDGFSNSTTIATGVDSVTGTPYAWTVPDAISTTVKVRVTNESDAAVIDSSDLNFKIAGSFTLNAPNGAESWGVGTSRTITWTRVGSIANAKLELSTNGGSSYDEVISASTSASAEAFIWTVPDSIGTNRKVKISDVSDASILDVSNAVFTIKGSFTVTEPDGGEVWTVASGQLLTWSTTGSVSNVKLEYSTNAFADELQVGTIVANVANSGSYSWTVADAISNLVRMRVSDVNNSDAKDVSDASFKIRGALLVGAPNGGEPWEIGTSQNITWTRTGSISNVKIEYSTNGFTDELQTAVIIASTPADPAPSDNAGIYAWTIPDTPSTTNKVRVSDASDATVLDTSNSNFIIKGRLVLSIPNGGEIWTVAGVNNITWTKFGAISNVQLQYSTDSGSTWPIGNLITASTAADPAPADDIGTYSWTIPDAIATTLRVRVQDAADSSTYDDSNADFKIKGDIDVTSPNGGEIWIVGTNQNVTWTSAGSFSNVKLEYSTDAFATEDNTSSITPATPNDGSFTWTIPDAIGSSLRVRASDAADNTVVDTTNSNFTIKGSSTVTSPNGGEVWKVGESRAITWNRAGSFANVKIDYSTNGGSTFPNAISASTGAGAGTYTWTIPDAIGSQVRVQVADASDSTVSDSSDSSFAIKGTVTLTAPNGSNQWPVDTAQNITWTKTGTYSTVLLEYSTNAFADELQTTVIASSVDAATGTPYSWTIPDAIDSEVRVRVTNESDATVTDKSDNNFKIVGSLELTAPNGGESWNVGTSQTVSWTRVGSIANVKLEYSANGGSTYPNLIVASTSAGAGAYSWTVPDSIGTNRRVKVTDVSDSTVSDASDANFAIVATFNITQPNGGEVWTVADIQNITWTTTGSVANVKLQYSVDNGTDEYANVITNSTPNNLTYSWTIPDTISTLMKVRISDVNNNDGFDTSNAVFKIRGALTVDAPNGGEQWGIGTSENIRWTRTGTIANVKLQYSSNGFSDELVTAVIIASTPADPAPSDNIGIYAWTIPDNPGVTNKVRVTDVADATVLDLSNGVFSIKGSLTITAPNGGESWIVGSPYNITWIKGGAISNVKLQYSTDSGVTWPDPSKVITSSTSAGFLSYTWTIPDDIDNNGRIRILDTNDNSVNDTSNADFSIRGSLQLTSPDGTEIWTVGDTHAITWTKTGTIANVKLEYSTDGGTNYDGAITASTSAAAGTYNWSVPDSISTDVRVKITQTNDALVTDSSEADFEIRGSLTVTSPNGGEVWRVASSQPITWTKTGTIPTVKLDYSVNGGSTYPNSIATGLDGTAGSYSWTIPNAITTNAKVRVMHEGDSNVFDGSDADFKIAGSITVTAPNGGQKWQVASTQEITWTITGSITNVKLEYANDAATYTNEIAASVNASSGTPYSWTIPDDPTIQARVKITNTGDATVFDTSNANFKIQGSIDLTSPNGGETWNVGESKSITWTKAGSFANVKIDYSTNSGATYPNSIAASTPSDNLSYSWTIPDNISETVRVRVQDVNDTEVVDYSAADLTIRGVLAITAPNGSEVWRVGQAQNITWAVTGTVAAAKLEYSTNGFSNETQTYEIVSTTPAANLTYAWNIPDAISNSVKVRVSDVDGISLGDTSNGNFSIKGVVTVTSPNGGESYAVNSVQNITWTRSGSFANVKLEYSTNGFSNEDNTTLITASAPADPAPTDNSGTYSWTVPDAIATTVKVRVTDANDAATTDASNNNFTIRGVLTITAPNGSEKWIVGTTQLITWDRQGSISDVKLQYTTNGSIFTNIILSTPNTGTYAWEIPNSVSTTVKVRIADVNNATVTDDSDANFKIQAGFTITAPNGGQVWTVGSTQAITWSTNGTVATVRLDYSTNSGTDYDNQITTSTNNTGSYDWIIPDSVYGTVKVRVSDTSDITAYDESNADFRIRASLNLIAPNGSEQWRVGQSRNITWSVVGTLANVKLVYSRDNFQADNQVIAATTPNVNTYAWTIPDSISNTVRVRISDPNDIGAYDSSTNDFRITGDFTVTSPNGAEKWNVDSDQTITWTQTGTVLNAMIEYSTNAGGSWSTVAGLTLNNGSYDWTVPDTITASARVRLSDPNDATANDISDANFKIKAGYELTAPNGGEIWTVADVHAITWTNTGTVVNAKLSYSTDSGANFSTVIIASTPNDGSYDWTIPDSISTTVRVRAGSANDVDAYDDSDANIKIRGKFEMVTPNGSEQWKIAQNFNITWVTTGTIPNVKLYYSTDSGSTYPNVIIASVANADSYTWQIPDVPTTNARIRVENIADVTVYDDSDANFKMQGNFILVSPNGGEAWIVASVHNITWEWGGTIPNVKLTYSDDSGLTYPNVINASAPNGAGSSGTADYAWTIPDAISTNVRVKIEDPNDSTVNDYSNANFKIRGDLALTSPNGGERWVTNETHAITWSTTGTIPNVKLTYSHDDFSDSTDITASVANTNTYNWVVPDPGVENVPKTTKVRVEDVNDDVVYDQSDASFNIDYYYVTWDIRDLLTNAALSELTVKQTKSSDETFVQWQETGVTTNPPRIQPTPYGVWGTVWKKTGYGDLVVVVEADHDQSFELFMETTVIHLWLADTRTSYNPATKMLDVQGWLSRDGSLTTGAVSATYKIYDGPTLKGTFTLDKVLDPGLISPTNPDGFTGYFSKVIDGGSSGLNLQVGKVYTTLTEMPIASGGSFKTPSSFEITTPSTLQQVADTVGTMLDKPLSQVETAIRDDMTNQLTDIKDVVTDKLDNQTSIVTSKLDNQTTIITQKLEEQTVLISDAITDFTEKSDAAVSRMQDEITRGSIRMILPDSVKLGSSVTIRLATAEGVSPTVDIMCPDGSLIAGSLSLTATATDASIYMVDFPFTAQNAKCAIAKAVTIVGSATIASNNPEEPAFVATAVGSMAVTSTDLDTIQGLAAAGLNAEKAAKDAKDAVMEVAKALSGDGSIQDSIARLQEKVDRLPSLISQGGESGQAQMRNTLDEVADKLNTFVGSEGFDMRTILKQEIGEGMNGMRNKMEQTKAAAEIVKEIVERKVGRSEEPIVQTFYEIGEVGVA